MTAAPTTHPSELEMETAARVCLFLLDHPRLTRAVLAGVRLAVDHHARQLDEELEHVQDEP